LITNKTIFISPLDWGLGHATRCFPIIKQLEKNNTVIIGVTELNSFFFEEHFPKLKKIHLPSYKIKYSKYLPVWLKILLQWPKIRSVIKEETKVIETIIQQNKIDVVISDNRFGLYNSHIESIFITHQLKIITPFFSSIANTINLNYIHHFNKIWVPDHEDRSLRLSGILSDSSNIKIPVHYIEPQSALTDVEINASGFCEFDYLIVLSGTEPQRSILEKLLLDKFATSTKKIVVVRGSNGPTHVTNKNIMVIDFAFGKELKSLILGAKTIICRSGYSTLMDLNILNKKKLILIPTPGQPEQEYLASYWKEKFDSKTMLQKEIPKQNFEI
jgi:uncharacterized protein (TIGR00661 family)